jgi:hypothetical protein
LAELSAQKLAEEEKMREEYVFNPAESSDHNGTK